MIANSSSIKKADPFKTIDHTKVPLALVKRPNGYLQDYSQWLYMCTLNLLPYYCLGKIV